MTVRGLLAFCILCGGFVFAVSAFGRAEESPVPPSAAPAQEARALWVVRYALGSPEAIHRIVQIAKARKFNTLLVQVRGRGDAYYLNGLEPRSEYLEKQPADFDPLAQIIREAHAAGLKVHAWMNTFYVWSGTALPKSPMHPVNAHPDWLLADYEGNVQYTAEPDREGAYLDPGSPDARRFIHDVFLDVATRYDVDGVHFDYVRYPGANYGYSDDDLRRFKETIEPDLTPEQREALDAAPDRNLYPKMFPERWKQWRRDNVTDLVRSVAQDVKRVKPNVAVSGSLISWGVFHSWEESDAYNVVTQDWFGWMREGLLDIAVPMTYHTDTASFSGWVKAAVQNRFRTQLWSGIGSYLITPESTAEKIEAERKLEAQGFSIFSYDYVTQDGTNDRYLQRVEALILPTEAVPPPLPRSQP
jgi:uncharacterized lipoprotein YddW (UPF0748 family)